MPASCPEGPGFKPGRVNQTFSKLISSAETQQPVNFMQRKARKVPCRVGWSEKSKNDKFKKSPAKKLSNILK